MAARRTHAAPAATASHTGHHLWPIAAKPAVHTEGLRRAAILMRGEPFRWGDDLEGRRAQANVYATIRSRVIDPLSTSYGFAYLLAVDERRGYSDGLYLRLLEYVGSIPAVFLRVKTSTQAENYREAVAAGWPGMQDADVVFVFRHDVSIQRAIHSWGCPPLEAALATQILLPSRIPGMGELVNDLYQIVPRQRLDVFSRHFFTNHSACFAIGMRGWQVNTGHFCHRVFDRANISYATCNATARYPRSRDKFRSFWDYSTHELSRCGTLLRETNPYRCGGNTRGYRNASRIVVEPNR